MRRASLVPLLAGLLLVACSATKPTSPTGCVKLAGMECRALLKQLRAEIPVGTTRAAAEETLKRHNLIYKFIPKAEVGRPPGAPPVRAGRLTLGVDDGNWPNSRSQGYLVDIGIDAEDRVTSFHVNSITAP